MTIQHDPSAAHSAASTRPPLVSVVMATYNRSNIIGWAIRALQAQTVTDWELLVIGDACSDDTEEVVAGFADSRIHFFNRAENFGEQSAANNDGVRMARGRFIAFLNHDDIWLDHHLATCLEAIESSQADLVFTVGLAFGKDPERPRLRGATTLVDDYHGSLSVPASLWLMRRELATAVGDWRPALELRLAPSHDWIHRADLLGARLLALRKLTVLLLTSGDRKDSYRDREDCVHEWIGARLNEPDFLTQAVLRTALLWEDRRLRTGASWLLVHGVHSLLAQFFACLGLFPSRPVLWLENLRKGAFIQRLRKTRGLDRLSTPHRNKGAADAREQP